MFLCTFSFAAEKVKINKVIDGDTIKIERSGKKETVRLIGVDTPESKRNKKAKKDAKRAKKDIDTITKLGKESTKHTKKLLKNNKEVYIETDVQKKDKYGRTLGYVYLDSKKKRMLNEEIIKDGYGTVMTIPPNVKYEKKLREAQKKSIKRKKGLWNDSKKKAKSVDKSQEKTDNKN
jgi:micrococcal nuclease